MARLSYDQMRNLILDNIDSLRNPTVFTPELLTAIFWEETTFQNMSQFGGGPAVGFGQVERTTIAEVNRVLGTKFTPEQILRDDNAAVQITSCTLSVLYHNLHSKMAALHGYAGSASNVANKPIPGRWISCETQLLAVHAMDRVAGMAAVYQRLSYVTQATAIKAALKAAKPNSDPNLAFPGPSTISI